MAEANLLRSVEIILAKCGLNYPLKEEQMGILKSLLDKQHTFGILPTGFGKSLPYMIFPLLKDSVSLPFFICFL
jgi:superfamily II DNA helicase RecQ